MFDVTTPARPILFRHTVFRFLEDAIGWHHRFKYIAAPADYSFEGEMQTWFS